MSSVQEANEKQSWRWTLLSGTQAPPELHLFITSGQFFAHKTPQGQFLLKGVTRHVHQPTGLMGFTPELRNSWGMLWLPPLPAPCPGAGELPPDWELTRIIPTCTKGLEERACGSSRLSSAPGKFYLWNTDYAGCCWEAFKSLQRKEALPTPLSEGSGVAQAPVAPQPWMGASHIMPTVHRNK